MEKDKEGILLKSRSSRACIADGFRLYLGQFRRIFRYTWVAALIFAIVNGIFCTYYVTEYPRLMVALQTGSAGWAQQVDMSVVMMAGALLVLMACILLWSYVFSMLNAHKSDGEMPWTPRVLHVDRSSVWRLLKATLWGLLFVIAVAVVVSAVAVMGGKVLSRMTAVGFAAVVLIVMSVLCVPLHYVFCKYLLTPGLKFTSVLRVGYAIGLRHIGTLLAVLIVTYIAVAMIAWLTSLPMLVLYLANIQAQTGVLLGDPLGMPSYMMNLTAAVFVLASFLQAYVLMTGIFPLYYAYGSIEVSEDERTKALNQMEKHK